MRQLLGDPGRVRLGGQRLPKRVGFSYNSNLHPARPGFCVRKGHARVLIRCQVSARALRLVRHSRQTTGIPCKAGSDGVPLCLWPGRQGSWIGSRAGACTRASAGRGQPRTAGWAGIRRDFWLVALTSESVSRRRPAPPHWRCDGANGRGAGASVPGPVRVR